MCIATYQVCSCGPTDRLVVLARTPTTAYKHKTQNTNLATLPNGSTYPPPPPYIPQQRQTTQTTNQPNTYTHRCKNVVFSSSATVYGDPEKLPITEDQRLQARLFVISIIHIFNDVIAVVIEQLNTPTHTLSYRFMCILLF
jgi:hypothetical protein